MKRFCTLFFVLAFGLQAEQRPPNIVFIFIDDWAWNGTPIAMDKAMANSKMPVLQMPHLKRLALKAQFEAKIAELAKTRLTTASEEGRKQGLKNKTNR